MLTCFWPQTDQVYLFLADALLKNHVIFHDFDHAFHAYRDFDSMFITFTSLLMLRMILTLYHGYGVLT